MRRWFAACVTIILSLGLPALADDTPKHGGTLTFMIPADSPPSFDGHRENTFATIHSVAPFYSVLIRANPENPADTTEFVCDVCVEIPKPTDGGRSYAFQIRGDVRFQDGSVMTAHDVAASWNKIVDPPEGVISVRRGYYSMIDTIEAPDPEDRRLSPQVRDRGVSAGARRSIRLHLQEGDPRPRPALVREEHHGLRSVPLQGLPGGTVDLRRAQPRLLPAGTALSGRVHRHLRRQAGGPGRRDQIRPGGDRVPRLSSRPRATSLSRLWATRSPCRRATGTAARWSRRTMHGSRSTMPGCVAL